MNWQSLNCSRPTVVIQIVASHRNFRCWGGLCWSHFASCIPGSPASPYWEEPQQSVYWLTLRTHRWDPIWQRESQEDGMENHKCHAFLMSNQSYRWWAYWVIFTRHWCLNAASEKVPLMDRDTAIWTTLAENDPDRVSLDWDEEVFWRILCYFSCHGTKRSSLGVVVAWGAELRSTLAAQPEGFPELLLLDLPPRCSLVFGKAVIFVWSNLWSKCFEALPLV